jgi:hypothetical protein
MRIRPWWRGTNCRRLNPVYRDNGKDAGPYRQQILGERIWGEADGSAQWMPGLFALHRYLLLGDTGKTIMALSGLVLAFSSLLGLLLWLPRTAFPHGDAHSACTGAAPRTPCCIRCTKAAARLSQWF